MGIWLTVSALLVTGLALDYALSRTRFAAYVVRLGENTGEFIKAQVIRHPWVALMVVCVGGSVWLKSYGY